MDLGGFRGLRAGLEQRNNELVLEVGAGAGAWAGAGRIGEEGFSPGKGTGTDKFEFLAHSQSSR